MTSSKGEEVDSGEGDAKRRGWLKLFSDSNTLSVMPSVSVYFLVLCLCCEGMLRRLLIELNSTERRRRNRYFIDRVSLSLLSQLCEEVTRW